MFLRALASVYRPSRSVLVVATAALLVAVSGVTARAATPANPLDSWKTTTLFAYASVTHAASVPATGALLVTLGPRDASLGNQLVELDPATGHISRHVYVGSMPWRIAVSQDSLFAYVALEGASVIVKVDLTTFRPVQHIVLPNHPTDGPSFAKDLAVAPGTNNVIVATLYQPTGISPNYPAVWAFRNGVALPNVVDPGSDAIEFQNASALLGFDHQGSPNAIQRMTLTADGVVAHGYFEIDGYGVDGEMAGKYLAQESGALVDPDTATVVRRFASGGWVEPTPASNRIAFVSQAVNTTLTLYQLSTGALIGAHTFRSLEVDNPRDVVATSAGYAIVAASGLQLFGPGVVPDAARNAPPAPKPVSATWSDTIAPVAAKDLAWDPRRRLLYASVGPNDATYPNEVVAFDSDTREVVKHVFVGGSPESMDITDLGAALFVTQRESRTVAKVDLVTFTVVQEIPLGTIDGFDVYGGDIDVMPLATDTFAIVLRPVLNDYTTMNVGGVALFTLGLRAPAIANSTGIHTIRFKSPAVLYGAGGYGRGWTEMLATPAGVEIVDVADGWLSPYHDFAFDSRGLVWGGDGSVFEPSKPFVVGRLVTAGPLVIDEARNRVFQYSDTLLYEYEMSSTKLLSVSNAYGYSEDKLVPFGKGVAAIGFFGVVFIAPPMCMGRERTVAGTTGTSANDVIIGTDSADTIDGGGGDDIICGRGGNDMLVGGAGRDALFGGAGNDRFRGGPGGDLVDGGDGSDLYAVEPGDGPHLVSLDGVANDGVVGEGDNVRPNVEIVFGSAGNDVITGSAGPESLYGGAGDDTLDGGGGADRLDGGLGTDTCIGGLSATQFSGCETTL
jgi:hypothetical protein